MKVSVLDMKNAVEELKEGDEWKETKVYPYLLLLMTINPSRYRLDLLLIDREY